jgi:hypothetical protein
MVSRLTVITLAMIGPLAMAQAQQSCLVGTWRSTHAADNTGPANVITITYAPDGGYSVAMTVPSLPGGYGSGVVRTGGTYRMVGPTTVQITYGDTVMCPAGYQCVPAPPGLQHSQAGTSVSFDFPCQGLDRVTEPDGSVLYHVR